MITILIYIALFYLAVNLLGYLLEKVKIPGIYAALFLGVALSTNQSIINFANSTSIRLLADIGMFLLLFLLGFSLNISELKKQGRLIVNITFWIIFSELLVGTLVLHFLFKIDWFLAGIVSISFATVGEVALLPILEKFKLIKTRLGQTILGVSVLDDVVEIIAFLLIIIYTGSLQASEILKEIIPVIAIFMGIIINKMSKQNSRIDKIVNVLALVAFGPFFFFYAGTEANISVIFKQLLLIILLTLLIKGTKLVSAYFASRKQLGTKKSLVLGVSLCIKFSTSIIILIILLQKNLISEELFSILIGIKVLFKFIVPVLLTNLLNRWHTEIFSTN